MELGYIGLGAMGGALARRLLLSQKMRIYDLNPEAVEACAEKGGIPTQSAAAMAQECDVVMTCLPTSDNVRAAIYGDGGLLEGMSAGGIIIDQTTGDPEQTREMAADLKEKGITLIDAPVSGGPAGADAGTIAIMVGGDLETFEKVKPVFESISPNIFHCGGIGNGHVMKLVNNVTMACVRAATLEAVAMGRKNGLDVATMAEIMEKSSGQSATTRTMLPALARGEESSNFQLRLLLKDVRLATQLGINSGAPMNIANLVRGMLQSNAYVAAEDAGINAMVPFIEKAADTKLVD